MVAKDGMSTLSLGVSFGLEDTFSVTGLGMGLLGSVVFRWKHRGGGLEGIFMESWQ